MYADCQLFWKDDNTEKTETKFSTLIFLVESALYGRDKTFSLWAY